MVKNPPANAGYVGLIPGLEDSTCCGATRPICHTSKPAATAVHAATREAHVPKALLHDTGGPSNEKPQHGNRSSRPRAAARESPRLERRPRVAKNKLIIY